MIEREWRADDYLAMLRRRWLVILALGIVGAGAGYGVSRLLANRYASQATILIEEPTVPTSFVRPVTTADVSERIITIQQQILSRARLEPLIDKLGLFSVEGQPTSMDSFVATLKNSISVRPMKPLTENENARLPGFTITCAWNDPKTAQSICSAISSMFIEQNLQQRKEDTEQTTHFLDQQIQEAKSKLDEHDARLATFEGRNLGYLPDDVQVNLNILAGLKSELDATTQALARAQQDKALAQSNLDQQIEAFRASQAGRNPVTYEEQLAALQTQLSGLQAKYTDDYPDVVKAKLEVAALKKKIAESNERNGTANSEASQASAGETSQFRQLRTQIATLDQTIAAKTKQQDRLEQEIKTYQDRVQSTPAIEQQYKELNRDSQTALEVYNDLLKKRAQSTMAADLERHQEGEQFQVLEPASLAGAPTYPNRPLFALGGLGGGLALGLAFGFMLEMRDTSLRSERDVEVLLSLPVLAVVPPVKVSRDTSSLVA
jgi:polysaccharide chain length determinant protein (PEP-CTERM system associated)